MVLGNLSVYNENATGGVSFLSDPSMADTYTYNCHLLKAIPPSAFFPHLACPAF
jgi:hypothetical protein